MAVNSCNPFDEEAVLSSDEKDNKQTNKVIDDMTKSTSKDRFCLNDEMVKLNDKVAESSLSSCKGNDLNELAVKKHSAEPSQAFKKEEFGDASSDDQKVKADPPKDDLKMVKDEKNEN